MIYLVFQMSLKAEKAREKGEKEPSVPCAA